MCCNSIRGVFYLQPPYKLLAYQRAVLTTSVKGSEADFHSPPGKRVSFWNTSSMNSVCPASASVNRLKHKVKHMLYLCVCLWERNMKTFISQIPLKATMCRIWNSTLWHSSVVVSKTPWQTKLLFRDKVDEPKRRDNFHVYKLGVTQLLAALQLKLCWNKTIEGHFYGLCSSWL